MIKHKFYISVCLATQLFTVNVYGMEDNKQLLQAQAYHEASDLYTSCGKKILANNLQICLDNKAILDIGCGTGKTTEYLAQKGLLVDGIDIRPDMIQFAEQKYGSKPNLTFQVSNIEEFTSQKSYDIAVALFCIHWVKDKEKSMRAIHEALNPDGILLATVKNPSYNDHIGIQIGLELVKDLLPTLNLTSSMGVSCMTDEEITELVEKTGFNLISLNHFEVQETARDLDELRKFYKFIVLSLPFIAHFSYEEKLALLEKYITRLAEVLPKDESGNYILGGNESVIYAQKK
jgi:2-polyprenyl-3-methyl-5-hydroxy-6-metoxy-1,4-benzoquinol methylase